MVKTPHFQCKGHGFDPWLGKFHMSHSVAKNLKKKRNYLEEIDMVLTQKAQVT